MRTCLFCTQPASSDEHVLPVWMLDLLPSVVSGVAAGRVPVVRHERSDKPLLTWYGSGLRNLKVKYVCKGCNTDWMAALEGCARPIMTPLILGTPARLDTLDQITIATWAIKTAMVFEATRVGGPTFYTREEHQYLFDHSLPPPRTSVWIAGYTGDLDAYCAAEDRDSHLDESFQRFDVYITTIAIGRLVIQVSSGHLPVSVPLGHKVWVDQTPGPWTTAARMIWQPSTEPITWPPRVMLTDTDPSLEAFASRWGAA